MDVESQQTINEAIDRFRDEVATPLLTAIQKLQALLERIDGATITLNLSPPETPK